MVSYEFSCTTCGPFEFRCVMREVTSTAACPCCGGPARRIYTAPATPMVAPGLRRMLDAQDASRHEPQVVSTVPSRNGRSRTTSHPLHRRLPGP